MKTFKTLLISAVLALGVASRANAQTTTTSTTLSSAVADTSTNVTFAITSATGWSASTNSIQYFYWVDGEYGRVQAVSGTTVTVARTNNVRRHASGAKIYFGTTAIPVLSSPSPGANSNFYNNGVFFNGVDPLGPCTGSQNTYLPVINTSTNRVWTCNSITGLWTVQEWGSIPDSPGQFTATFVDGATGSATDRVFFIATRGYRVVACSQLHSVAAGGTSTLQVVKDTGTDAPGAGTDILSAAFNLNATANTIQAGSLVTTSAVILAAGNRLSVDYANTIQSSAGVTVSCDLIPN